MEVINSTPQIDSRPLIHLSPYQVLKRGIIKFVKEDQIQQVGIDLTTRYNQKIESLSFANIEIQQSFDMQNCFGLIFIRSSYSRNGIFCSSGVYDCGFVGVGGLTVYNMNKNPILLMAKTRIAQMIVFEGACQKPYDGFYNNNQSINSKIEKGD